MTATCSAPLRRFSARSRCRSHRGFRGRSGRFGSCPGLTDGGRIRTFWRVSSAPFRPFPVLLGLFLPESGPGGTFPLVVDRIAIGQRLAKARRQARLTQKEAAEAIRVGLKTLQNWEAGSATPPADNLADLVLLLQGKGCRVDANYLLGTPPSELLGGVAVVDETLAQRLLAVNADADARGLLVKRVLPPFQVAFLVPTPFRVTTPEEAEALHRQCEEHVRERAPGAWEQWAAMQRGDPN